VTPAPRTLAAMWPRLSTYRPDSLKRALTWFHTAPGRPRLAAGEQPGWRRVLPVAAVGMALAAVLVGARVGLPDQVDPIAPFTVGYIWEIGPALEERGVRLPAVLAHDGYDGQWFLGQAYDPLLFTDMASTFDTPRYRAMRVLMPAAGWLLAAGQPALIPYALLLLGILAVGLGCAVCARIVAAYGRSRWWGTGFALIPGVVIGVAYGTAEPLGLALAALGISLALQKWYGWAGLAFAGAALTKETYLAFAVGVALFLAVQGYVTGVARARWTRDAAMVLLPGTALLAAWWVYVHASLGSLPPEENYGTFERFEPPFVGWVEAIATMVRGDYPHYHSIGIGHEAVLVASLVIAVAAIAYSLKLRQSVLAYLAFGQGVFGLIIAGFLLERFASAQRALAPAVLATALFLIIVRRVHHRAEPPPARVPEAVKA
jgi:hypothetical protein